MKKKVKPPKDTTLPPLVTKINDTIYVSVPYTVAIANFSE